MVVPVPVVRLPPEDSRRVVRDRVLAAAVSAQHCYGVNTNADTDTNDNISSTNLDEDPDSLSKDVTALQRDEQYKDRLQAVLGKESLLPVVNTCLLLDNNSETTKETSSSSIRSTTVISLHDAFACVTLLLCNVVVLLLAASDENKNKNNINSSSSHPRFAAAGGYDARIRNVLRMASIDLLAEALKWEDTDGNFLERVEQLRPTRSKAPDTGDSDLVSGSGQDKEESSVENIESQLFHLLEEEYQHIDGASGVGMEGAATGTGEATALGHAEPSINDSNIHVFDDLYRRYATRKYQALEKAMSDVLMNHVVHKRANMVDDSTNSASRGEAESGGGGNNQNGRFSRKNMLRAAKIGGVGVVAGTLFAVTGGLAAPGIAAGLAALGVGGTVLTLAASKLALIALFGVGGGGLSAYKMKRRTDGLCEFIINGTTPQDGTAYLHTTVCVSGWLKDEHDFQRPWGVMPTNLSRLERLQRFYSVVDPEKVQYATDLMNPYSSGGDNEQDAAKDKELWQALSMALKVQYGKAPDDLLPLDDRAMTLSVEEDATMKEIVDQILHPGNSVSNPQLLPTRITISTMTVPAFSEERRTGSESRQPSSHPNNKNEPTFRVWDYQTEYGGDLYTIQWESAVLLKMSQVANSMVKELANKVTAEVLKKAALATILAAVALPAVLMGMAGSLDNDWTLVSIRSDLAGVELARSLLQSNERRPVNLIGFSFGARIIYACLLELARHQTIWQEQQQQQQQQQNKRNGTFMKKWKKKGDEDSIEYVREPASIVQDVVLMGAPVFIYRSKLRLVRQMVAGRFVNCYSRKDWILSMMFKYHNTSGIMRGTCGTCPIDGVGGIENYNVSSLISSWHARYCQSIPDILDFIGFDQPMPTDKQR